MDLELVEKLKIIEARLESSKERVNSAREDIDEKKGAVLSLDKQSSNIEENISNFENSIDLSSSKLNSNNYLIKRKTERLKELDVFNSNLSLSLREITEDIVKELDEKLKAQDISVKEKKEEAKHLSFLIEKLLILSNNKISLIQDFSISENFQKEKVSEFLQKIISSFDEVSSLSQDISLSFEKYKEYSFY